MSKQHNSIRISQLMAQSGVRFGTSGARGLTADMTDRVCYIYTLAFIQHLKTADNLASGGSVAIAGDYRSSTPHIMAAVAMAIRDAGYTPLNCGLIPTPALALYAMSQNIPGIMVTGSHIPDNRNGIKFYKCAGEILKEDEAGICSQHVSMARDLFDNKGHALQPYTLPAENRVASEMFARRYLDFFPANCLQGKVIGIYEQSTVARDVLAEVIAGLGARIIRLGRSETFIPVDTEAIRPEDVLLARRWADEYDLDCIVSADGDGDRPLVSDEKGNWLRGDIAGILCARYLSAEFIATPVSCNSAVEKCGWFRHIRRTRIGSPFVIAALNRALEQGIRGVVGYEANGGFITADSITIENRTLAALPTRDAVIVPLAILLMATRADMTVSSLLGTVPRRFTCSDRLESFPADLSRDKLAALNSGNMDQDIAAAEAMLGKYFGDVETIDFTDGIRITFGSEEVVHLRPSGNAPELRCYNEADSEERASEMNALCLKILARWRC